MSYLEKLLPELRKGAKIRQKRWKDGAYIEKLSQGIIYHYVERHEVDILADDYELYQKPIDWDYIIKNKSLCLFWDDDAEYFMLGFLLKISNPSDQFGEYKYKDHKTRYWKHCRPMHRDEVTFYEDKKE